MLRRNFIRTGGLLPFVSKSILESGPVSKSEEQSAARAQPAADAGRDFFYRPQDAWAADFIPLYANGAFQLFYLLDWRNIPEHGEGTPWYRVTTNDFVHFREQGEMLKRGTKTDQDLYVFTGSAIHANNQYHIFYTGHNPYLRKQGKPEQGVMHAVSDDMKTWTKMPEHTFFAPVDKYEKDDWRDPFVFWNEADGEFNMLLAARHRKGIPRRRGLTALCSSKDLVKWVVRDPFYAPDLYFTHECPDLFKMGDWWYLLFSEFTDRVRTRYRMSRSLQGPWTAPLRDDFDGHAFYAAKSASDGKSRFLFGWNPTRNGSKDTGNWQWGGNLVVHELKQESNGELSVKIPAPVARAFAKKASPVFNPGAGNYKTENETLSLHAAGTFCAASAGPLPALCRISTSIKFEKGAKDFGLMFRTSDDLEQSYYLRIEPPNNRIVFDKWPREHAEVTQLVELERPLYVAPGDPIQLQVIIQENMGVVYVNDTIAMNFRAYDLPAGNWGFFASDGNVSFGETEICTR
jgi:beta-fructofuranosidase